MTAERNWFPLTGTVIRSRGGLVAAARKKGPIDPLSGLKLALAGRVVIMDDGFSVKDEVLFHLPPCHEHISCHSLHKSARLKRDWRARGVPKSKISVPDALYHVCVLFGRFHCDECLP